ncbi:hypothetical protein VNI00_008852 [Paramarasmius palmivorus]|uniref:Uncharacterized protein n=1 Tax=Paramarasmius palmivorus TaxID=297713 RepID=A0AAW0CRL4_9AGAR
MRWLPVLCIAVVPSWGLNVTIDNVEPTSAVLRGGSILLHITWHADEDGSFKFALKKFGVDDYPIASTQSIDSKSSASGFIFESISPGKYSLVASNDDVSATGVYLDEFSAPIQATDRKGSQFTLPIRSSSNGPITSSSNQTSNSNIPIPQPTSVSDNPMSNVRPNTLGSAAAPTSTTHNSPEAGSKTTRSLIIGATTGPICFTASILVIGIYLLRKRRESKNRTVSRPFDAPCVPKSHRKIESPSENSNDDNPTVTVAEAIRSPPRIRRHNDSGWRPGPPSEVDSGSGSNVLDLPPEYEYAL